MHFKTINEDRLSLVFLLLEIALTLFLRSYCNGSKYRNYLAAWLSRNSLKEFFVFILLLWGDTDVPPPWTLMSPPPFTDEASARGDFINTKNFNRASSLIFVERLSSISFLRSKTLILLHLSEWHLFLGESISFSAFIIYILFTSLIKLLYNTSFQFSCIHLSCCPSLHNTKL